MPTVPSVPGLGSGVSKPPFDASTLKAPLTSAQRAQIIVWILAYQFAYNPSTVVTSAELQAKSDTDLIAVYTVDSTLQGIQTAPITDTPSGTYDGPAAGEINSVSGLISALSSPNTWTRIAEFGVGFLLLGIGIYAVVKNTGAGKAVGGVAKVAVPELGIAHAAKGIRKAVSDKGQYRAAPEPSTTHIQRTHIGSNGKARVTHQYTTTTKGV